MKLMSQQILAFLIHTLYDFYNVFVSKFIACIEIVGVTSLLYSILTESGVKAKKSYKYG